MKRIAPLAFVAAVLAAPAFAGGMDFTLPNLTFPPKAVTVSTSDCDATANPSVCIVKN